MQITAEKKNLYIRRLIFTLILLVSALLQNTPGVLPEIFGARLWLLLPATVCVAMFERETAGLFFGLFAGLMWDVSSADSGSFYSIILTAVGFACGALINHIMRNNLVTAWLLCTASVLLFCATHWLVQYVLPSLDRSAYTFASFYLPSALATLLLLPIFYSAVRNIMKSLR